MTETEPRSQITTAAGFGPKIRRSRVQQLRLEAPGFIKKNRGLLGRRAFWSMLGRLGSARISASATRAEAPVMFVATHHKVMTTYFNAVLRLLALGTGRKFQRIHIETPDPDAKLVLSMQGKLNLSAMRPYRGVHIMRDPRDMIVSGYHYHKWTHEAWVHRPDDNGVSYQQKLNQTDKTAGLFLEIDHFIFFYRDTLEAWDIDDPDILEVPYEDLMGEGRDALYSRIFTHLGFKGRDLGIAVDLMRLFEAKSRTGRKSGAVAEMSHVRSGKSGQWKAELGPEHVAYIERELGPVLRKFGYAAAQPALSGAAE